MVPNLATHPISCLYFLLRSISIVRNISSHNCKYYLKIEEALHINVKNLICTHNKIIQFSLFHCNFCGRSSLTELQPQPCNIFTKDALAQVFSCEFCEIRNITFFTEHLRWLFLLQSPCGHFLHRLKYIVFFFSKLLQVLRCPEKIFSQLYRFFLSSRQFVRPKIFKTHLSRF